MTLIQTVPEGHVEGHPIERRMVRFDWSNTPAHWVPGDPFASHVINVLHLLLPAGETWFIEVVNRVRTQIKDRELLEAVKPFIQQESWHAQAHQHVLDALDAQGIDSRPYTAKLEKMFSGLIAADHPNWPSWLQRWMERRNLAAVAAIEHFTAVLGHWILTHHHLDDSGADSQMLDLLRWHGAEEVEHRALVFDVHRAVGGRWIQRATAMLNVGPSLALWWIAGVRFLIRHDPAWAGPGPRWRDFFRSARTGHVPTLRHIFRLVPNYLRPSYHPSQEFSTELALEYLAKSPAAHDAAARKAGAPA
jgi:predicted metal-dependent hydrolase